MTLISARMPGRRMPRSGRPAARAVSLVWAVDQLLHLQAAPLAPVAQQEVGKLAIGDEADMRAAIGEADDGVGVAQQLGARIQGEVGILGQRAEQEALAVIGQQHVVGDVLRAAALARRLGGDAGLAVRGIVRRVAEGNIRSKDSRVISGKLLPLMRSSDRMRRRVSGSRMAATRSGTGRAAMAL